MYEIGSGIYDAYNAIRTLRDPSASRAEKIGTVALAAASVGLPGGGYTGAGRIASRIGDHAGLAREASSLSGGLQRSVDALTSQLARGNFNPGIGTKHLFGDVFYARSRDGARVFFRQGEDGIEILAKASKQNESRVINMLEGIYK